MKRIIRIVLVLNGVGLAVALCLKVGLGSDSIGLLSDGIHRVLNIQYGYASFLYNIIVILIAFVFARKHLALGSVAYALTSGFFIDFYLWILQDFTILQFSWFIRLLFFLVGHVLLTGSLALLIQLNLGMNALDALLYTLSDKVKIPYKYLRMFTDISYACIGTLFGGVFGIGTIISVLTTGICIAYFVKKLQQLELNKDMKLKMKEELSCQHHT